jgi:hypothetical protein
MTVSVKVTARPFIFRGVARLLMTVRSAVLDDYIPGAFRIWSGLSGSADQLGRSTAMKSVATEDVAFSFSIRSGILGQSQRAAPLLRILRLTFMAYREIQGGCLPTSTRTAKGDHLALSHPLAGFLE